MKPNVIKYNPAFLSQEELIQSFVVRQVDLDLIIETIKENTDNSNQHVLIIGPRGMGKTMLVLRAMASIANDKELNAQWYPIVFSEESYEVFTAAEFWLRAIFHLSKQTKNENLMQIHEQLKAERDEKRLYERALACLMDFADEQNKRLLLVVENINMLLEDQIGLDETWDIRHTLLNEPRIMLLGTAPSRFDEIDNAGKAMFDLFKIHHLEALSTQDSKCLWEFLTEHEVEENIIRPIHILTGGNPRLLAIISYFAAGASFRELMKQLTFLIDEYTTYFKSNIESLPSLERKVFITLANIWEPATAARVAQDARIPVNKASSLLKRLEFRGCVSAVKSSGRKNNYQVSERLYNIYHLMRISGHQSDRVRAVVDFMINFYQGKEQVKKMAELSEESEEIFREAIGNNSKDYLSCANIELLYHEKLAQEELVKEPDPVYQHNYASILGAQGKWEEALSTAVDFLKNTKSAKEFPNDIIFFFINAAVAGYAKEGLNLLKKSACAPYMEPLIVALQMLTGEEYNAPQEVVEVAKDVLTRIEKNQKENK
jgi:hypothetical protein